MNLISNQNRMTTKTYYVNVLKDTTKLMFKIDINVVKSNEMSQMPE